MRRNSPYRPLKRQNRLSFLHSFSQRRAPACTRRAFLGASIAIAVSSCQWRASSGFTPVLTWGETGLRDGQFKRPRAIAAWRGEVFVIDKTGRVQVFDSEGKFARTWMLPKYDNGTPTGITPLDDGRLLIPDTHNSRLLEYDPSGELLRMWGEYGTGEDEFIYVTDVVLDDEGRYIFSEYGMDAERVHIFSSDREFEQAWGTLGESPGEFSRAMAIVRPSDGRLYVCDTANHRIQCFEPDGTLVQVISEAGLEPGQLKFPYDIDVAPDDSLIVCEYGNNRISRFSTSGELIGCFGGPGRGPGEFNAPRGACVSEDGFVYVADTDNDRIQRIPLVAIA